VSFQSHGSSLRESELHCEEVFSKLSGSGVSIPGFILPVIVLAELLVHLSLYAKLSRSLDPPLEVHLGPDTY